MLRDKALVITDLIALFDNSAKSRTGYVMDMQDEQIIAEAVNHLRFAPPEVGRKKVYALIGGWNYEGHAEPEGIYSTREKAEAAKAGAYDNYDYLDVYEYELDDVPSWSKPSPQPQGESK